MLRQKIDVLVFSRSLSFVRVKPILIDHGSSLTLYRSPQNVRLQSVKKLKINLQKVET